VRWAKRGEPVKEVSVIVHHKNFTYLIAWLGMREAGSLVRQILWVSRAQLAWARPVSALIAAVWFGFGRTDGRVRFIFATLIIPALATRQFGRRRVGAGYAVAALSYAGGLVLSMWTDRPAGPLVVCTMTVLGLALFMASSLLLRT
jgi:hypothetical protein